MIEKTPKQYDDLWWAARRGVPTSSCFDAICTPAKGTYSASSSKYIADLIAEIFDPNYGQTESYISAAMKNGTILEPSARAFYEFDRECRVRETGLCMDDDERFGCSPDALVGDDGGAEIKCPTPAVHVQYLLDGGIPDKYKPQVHGTLIVTGRKWWDFMSYCPGFPPLLVRVEPDDYTVKLRACMDQFWTEYQEALAKIKSMGVDAPTSSVEADADIILM